MSRKTRVGIVSLGCPRNLVDSESLLGRLAGKGYRITGMEHAEIGIVNTCAFVEDAKTEAIEAILELARLKKMGSLRKIIVCGCLAQRYGDTLRKEFPEVDAFVGSPALFHQDGQGFSLTPKSYAYLKICEGCVNNCSFCSVPLIKSRLESLDEESVMAGIDRLDRERFTEVDIIGQDITGYGIDSSGKGRLAQILRAILKHSKYRGKRWFRLLYLHPARVGDDLLRLIRDEPRICKYIDLPVQHINSRILRLMNRHTGKKEIIRLIERARKLIPGVAIRSSLIVGFPGETDAEFREMVSFVKDTGFERLGAFIYSREEGTPAFSFSGQVPGKVQRRRFDEIMSVQQGISERKNRELLGKTLDVLIDEKDSQARGHYLGRTQHDAPEVDGTVFVKSRRALKTGDIVRVRITDTLEYDLSGEVANEHRE